MSAPLTIEQRLDQLERRLIALEAKAYHRGGLGRAVRHVIDRWPGPFTTFAIRDAVYEISPELKPVTEQHQVSVIVARMEKQGLIICTHRGAGPNPNLYERTTAKELEGRAGSKFGQKHANESGFRSIVRSALDDLPKEFTIEDLRKWLSEKAPDARVPSGTWSSTLHRMSLQNELVKTSDWSLVNGRRRRLKKFRRGPRRIAPTGDEIRDFEAAWREFRKEMSIAPTADFETPLERGVA